MKHPVETMSASKDPDPASTTRLLTWNLNHRAKRRPIHDWIATEIAERHPHVAVLTEYVEGPDHERFCQELAAQGLTSQLASRGAAGHNQILIGARTQLYVIPVLDPGIHAAVPSNFLHSVGADGLHVIGFRMPAFKSPDRALKRKTWNWLIQYCRPLESQPTILLGDFNTADGDSPAYCGDCLDALSDLGWHRVTPAGHSWTSGKTGGERSIDHAFLSPALKLNRATYDWDFQVRWRESASQRVGIPDHAMLVVDVDLDLREDA